METKRRAEMGRVMEEYESSGLTRREFCAKRGLTLACVTIHQEQGVHAGDHGDRLAIFGIHFSPRRRTCAARAPNNLAENSMRPVAVGRKNWLHVGSAASGPKVAAILSVVESCRRLDVPVKDYLLAVLPGMARRKLSDVASLTPARWSASRS